MLRIVSVIQLSWHLLEQLLDPFGLAFQQLLI
jgi:hypothetical protein